MTGILNLNPVSEMEETKAPEQAPSPARSPALDSLKEEPAEFEFVLGRRQVASTGLVLTVLLAVFSGVSYLVGRSAARVSADAVAAQPIATPTAIPAPVTAAPVPKPQLAPPAPAVVMPSQSVPVFGEAETGKVYLQVGAIEKGIAGIWAEGLRAHGLDAFVATGPSDKMWRVLIGPLPDPQAYTRAKNVLDSLGIDTFGRKYQQ